MGLRDGLLGALVVVVASSAVLLVPADAGERPPQVAAATEAVPERPWPGPQAIAKVDVPDELGTDVSALSYRAGATRENDVLWGLDDREGKVLRLVRRSGVWRPDTWNGWSRGKSFTFPDGRVPDAEGLVVHGGNAWMSTERDATGVSRLSILRVPLDVSGTSLGAAKEWRLDHDFPAVGPNSGLESLDFVPDSFLVARGFHDEARGGAYDPAAYPDKVSTGVFFTAAEASSTRGEVRGYVLQRDGSAVRVATIANPLGLVRALEFDAHAERLWVVCDDDCSGRSATAQVRDGRFVVTEVYTRPTGLPDHNNEGFTVAPGSHCVDGSRPVFWSNDSNNESHAIRQGRVSCAATTAPDPEPTPGPTPDPTPTPYPTPPPDPGAPPVPVVLALEVPVVQAGRPVAVRVSASTGTDAPGGVTPRGEVLLVVGERRLTAALEEGRAQFDLAAFVRPGTHRLEVRYGGDARTAPSLSSSTLRVVRAATRFVPVRPRARVSHGTRVRLRATLRANGLPTTGRVRVKVGQRFVRARVRRAGERLVVRTPRLTARGRVRVTLVYRGDVATTPARAVFRLRVRRR